MLDHMILTVNTVPRSPRLRPWVTRSSFSTTMSSACSVIDLRTCRAERQNLARIGVLDDALERPRPRIEREALLAIVGVAIVDARRAGTTLDVIEHFGNVIAWDAGFRDPRRRRAPKVVAAELDPEYARDR